MSPVSECACMCWCAEFQSIKWPRSKAFGEWEGWIWVVRWKDDASLLGPKPIYLSVCTLPVTKHLSKRDPTPVQREPETSQNRAGGKERKRRKWVEETFRGPKCQRYHYLSISLDETHLAGLGSHSQWDPEVKGASDQDEQAAVGCRQPVDEEEEERLCTGSAFVHNKGTLLVSAD